MGTSPNFDSSSSKMSRNPEEQSGIDAFSEPHTDPAEDNWNASSEEYTDSDDDSNPGIAGGGFTVIDLENAPADIVQKVDEGMHAVIDDFNQRHDTTYKLVEIEKVLKSISAGYGLSLYFTAERTDSPDNTLTKFEAFAGFPFPDYKLEVVQCEAKSLEQGMESDEEIWRVAELGGESAGTSAAGRDTGSVAGSELARVARGSQRKRGRSPADKESKRLNR